MNPIALRSLVVLVLAGPFVGKYISANWLNGGDSRQVREALDRALEACRKGEANPVLDTLSDQLKVNDQSAPSRRDVAQFIRQARPEITVASAEPFVYGDQARMTAPTHVRVQWLLFSADRDVGAVTYVFRRETGFEWLVVPVPRWRLSEVLVSKGVVPEQPTL
ncbi:MAG: hypothetical protein HYR64_01435 [Fimbriimonas ginsengisoli]|uniref:Uncharacterized protein n=1 Tax=Fimbriimonas ginsengisoli TaxID=1005039 RepID=A0A931LQS5_FIMGI|nr:hypothetical protein [Fimbriimonas ginsengisoli]